MLLILLACDSDKPAQDDTAADTDTPDPDSDGDGYPASTDCDDTDPAIHPDATEACNDVDDDCDGSVDDGAGTPWYPDADGDGYTAADATMACEPAGDTAAGTDCDDAESLAYPGAPEACGDTRDFDCDGWTLGCDIEDLPHARILGDTRYYSQYNQMALDGDLDGDGRSDLVIANAPSYDYDGNDGTVSVFSGAILTRGAELTMSASPSWTTQDRRCGDAGVDVDFGEQVSYVGDVDGGGGDDVVVVSGQCGASPSEGGSAAIWIFQGEQFGSDWSASADDAVLLEPTDELRSVYQIGSGDFSGDGIPDVVLSGYVFPILYLDGAGFGDWDGRTMDDAAEGSIACTVSADCWHYYGLDASGDFDGDGQDDLVFISERGLHISQHTPVPGETQDDAEIFLPVDVEDTFLPEPAGDVDGDGRPELVANRYHGTGEARTHELAVFSGSDLATAVTIDDWTWHIPDGGTSGSVGDVDGDGQSDLSVSFVGYEEPDGRSAYWVVSGSDIVSGADPSRVRGPYVYDQLLCGVGRGDVDADGFDDFLFCSYETGDLLGEEYFVMFGG
jgi:hypothetical protein